MGSPNRALKHDLKMAKTAILLTAVDARRKANRRSLYKLLAAFAGIGFIVGMTVAILVIFVAK